LPRSGCPQCALSKQPRWNVTDVTERRSRRARLRHRRIHCDYNRDGWDLFVDLWPEHPVPEQWRRTFTDSTAAARLDAPGLILSRRVVRLRSKRNQDSSSPTSSSTAALEARLPVQRRPHYCYPLSTTHGRAGYTEQR
jgi:hypothetical protein